MPYRTQPRVDAMLRHRRSDTCATCRYDVTSWYNNQKRPTRFIDRPSTRFYVWRHVTSLESIFTSSDASPCSLKYILMRCDGGLLRDVSDIKCCQILVIAKTRLIFPYTWQARSLSLSLHDRSFSLLQKLLTFGIREIWTATKNRCTLME